MDDRSFVAQALFRFLEREGAPWCVVGDTRDYPQAIASDVDIVLDPGAFAGVARLVARFCAECDVRLVQWIEHERTAVYCVLAWLGEEGGFRFLAVDFCSDYCRGARLMLAAEDVLDQCLPATDASGYERGFRVPAPAVQFIYYLMKKVDKLELDDEHGEYLSECWRGDPDGCWARVARYWPVGEEAGAIARAAAADRWFPVRAVLRRLRRTLRRATPLSAPALAGELGRRIRRGLRPTGLTVAVLGPDGSGKSSVIERMLADLAPAFRRTQRLHLRPRLIGAGRAPAGDATDPHALPARGPAASLAKLALFLADYLLGHALRIWPLKCRSTLVVFDRHYRDLAVDAKRYRYGGPLGLVRWAARFVPGPDVWVVLDAPAAVLQSRKREVPPAESERQRRAYRELAEHLPSGVVVDAAQELPRVAGEAEAAVLRWLEGRLEYRYPQLQLEQNPLSARLLLYFCRRRTPVLAKLFRIVFNSDIHTSAIAPILMAHPYGIVIHGDTVIGHRVTIMQQVTLGAKDRGVHAAPVIEDDVYIGAGAKVLGAVRIGRGAVIGANAVVTRDVPPHCTVVGANRIVHAPAQDEPREEEAAEAEMAPERERLSA